MTMLPKPNESSWREVVATYQKPHLPHSLGQLVTTLIPYFTLLYATYLSLRVSYALTLALTVPAAGFLVRIFIIMHDCGHGDVWTLTLQEYLTFPRWKRMWYRIYRNPVVMFGVGPLYLCLIRYRFWRRREG